MTIFITIPWFYPAYKAGGPIQSIVNMINELQDGIEYKIFCGNTDLTNDELKGIKTDQWIQFNACTQVWYATPKNRSNDLLKEVENTAPDVLYIVGLFSWHFNIVPLFFCKATTKILSVRGMLHTGALTQKKLKKQFFLTAFRLSGIYKKIIFHATDKDEKKNIEHTFGKQTTIAIASNFSRIITRTTTIKKEPGVLHLISIALISPMKNYLLVLQALAEYKPISNETIYYNIYGPVKDEAYWQLCLAQIEKMPTFVQVSFHRDVPPQLVPEKLSHNEVFIMPSKSENFGHAIAEALSAGLPVITSTYTPWNELVESKAGVNVDNNIESIKKAIQHFVQMNNDEFQQWSAAAAKHVRSIINVEDLKMEYQKMFQLRITK